MFLVPNGPTGGVLGLPAIGVPGAAPAAHIWTTGGVAGDDSVPFSGEGEPPVLETAADAPEPDMAGRAKCEGGEGRVAITGREPELFAL